MNRRFALLTALALSTGCVHDVLQVGPPLEARERHRAEADACWRGAYPYWMDDAALSDAARRDRLEGDASRANESFQAGTAMAAAQPPPAPRASDGGMHTRAILQERSEFDGRCALLRSGGALR